MEIPERTKNIIAAMKQHNVEDLVATAMPSYKVYEDRFQLSFQFAIFMVKTFMRYAYNNIVESAKLIANSNLKWTIVRMLLLNNNQDTGKITTGYVTDGNVKMKTIPRLDLANFIRQQIEDEYFLHKAPLVST